MKKLFPLLLCYTLMATQCYAISGGPVYGGGTSVNVVGAYSGVIVGVSSTGGTSAPVIPGDNTSIPLGVTQSNALGLFDLTVPGVSTSTGTFVLFASGQVYTGNIYASADPDTGKLQGVLEGRYDFNVSTESAAGTVTTTMVTATAEGQLNANIRAAAGTSNTTARLTGTAALDISYGGINTSTFAPIVAQTLLFTVSGFQQTSSTTAASAVSTLSGLTGGVNGPGGAGG